MTKHLYLHIMFFASHEGDNLIIDLNSFLKSGNITYSINKELNLTDKEFIKQNKLSDKVMFIGTFFKTDKNIVLNAEIEFEYEEICARCLKKCINTIRTQLNANVLFNTNDYEETEEINIIAKEDTVNLEDAIKQAIYPSIPMKTLCKEDCKGICANCGIDLNTNTCECNNNSIDPRLEELKKLLNN